MKKQELARLESGLKFVLEMEMKLAAVRKTIDSLQHEDAFMNCDGSLWAYDDFDAQLSGGDNDENVHVLGTVGNYWGAMEDAAEGLGAAMSMFEDKAHELYERICAIKKAE